MSRRYKGKKVHHHRDGSITVVTRLGPKQRNQRPKGCFPSTTLVLTPFGGRRISEFGAGDEVLSYELSSQKLVSSRVVRRIDVSGCQLWSICFQDAPPILVTGFHSFLCNRGWVQARLLGEGDKIHSISGLTPIAREVIAVNLTERREDVHNLITSGQHNFIADGAVVHNFSYLRGFRTWMYSTFLPVVKPDLTSAYASQK